MSSILDFYEGKPSRAPYTLEVMWQLPLSSIEERHDIIQWLFPLNVPSAYNPNAPVLTQEDIDVFHFKPYECAISKEHNSRALSLVIKLTMSVRTFIHFLDDTADNWCTQNNHNHLRITRMIKCLMLMQMEKPAASVYNEVIAIVNRYPYVDMSKAIKFWTEAL